MSPLETLPSSLAAPGVFTPTGRRIIRQTVAALLAAAVAWLIFESYRQPDLMLDLAGIRLCAAAPADAATRA